MRGDLNTTVRGASFFEARVKVHSAQGLACPSRWWDMRDRGAPGRKAGACGGAPAGPGQSSVQAGRDSARPPVPESTLASPLGTTVASSGKLSLTHPHHCCTGVLLSCLPGSELCSRRAQILLLGLSSLTDQPEYWHTVPAGSHAGGDVGAQGGARPGMGREASQEQECGQDCRLSKLRALFTWGPMVG